MSETSDSKKSKARERHERRMSKRQTRKPEQVSAKRPSKQISPTNAFWFSRIRLPQNRYIYLIPIAIVLVLAVILVLFSFRNEAPQLSPNAIWLDANWTHQDLDEQAVLDMAHNLEDNSVGTVYAFVSSLNSDGNWSGLNGHDDNFNNVRTQVRNFRDLFKEVYPDGILYAWIEVQGDISTPQVQNRVASFSLQAVEGLGFDGVLLDVKGIWGDNENFLSLLRQVRGTLGVNTLIAVSVPPDLTPPGTNLVLPDSIAPNTAWSKDFKQRVALQADELIINAFHSYQTDPEAYQNWVQYQVNTFNSAVAELDTNVIVLVAVPAYADQLPAHDTNVENIETAVAGIKLGLEQVGASEMAQTISGVAVFADRELAASDWSHIHEISLE